MADQPKEERGITAIAVSGFKSLRDESRIEIRNLTVLAGANSSGKSSIMQPLLMLKQTLEAPYDPGPLKLDGPNVSFTEARQLSTNTNRGRKEFQIQIDLNASISVRNKYRLVRTKSSSHVELRQTVYVFNKVRTVFDSAMSKEDIVRVFRKQGLPSIRNDEAPISAKMLRERSFLSPELQGRGSTSSFTYHTQFLETIVELIHVPGIRSSLKGAYPSAYTFDNRFTGTFDQYIGGVVLIWQETNDQHYTKLIQNLSDLKLTSYIAANRQNDVQIELSVGRALHSSSDDIVKIAHVGLGVPQILPVLVALLVAEPGQLVYIEQPELHLHPRAQVKLAEIIADAANRGVRVVIETHSDLLILGIQTLVAEGKLSTDNAIFHWFTRDDEGVTYINSTELEKDGAFKDGSWPEDFAEVRLDAQSRFLDAADLAELTSNNAE